MTVPVVVSSTAGLATSTSDASVTVTLPASIAAGELILVFFRDNWTGTSTPSGYTPGAANQATAGYFWKIADGTEGGTNLVISASAGTGRAAAIALRVSGNHSTPLDVDAVSGSTTGPNLSAPTVTTLGADRLILVGDTVADGTSGSLLGTLISGYANVREASAFNTNPTSARVSVQSGAKAAAGATGAQGFTVASTVSAFRVFTVAIAPAVSAPVRPPTRKYRHLVVR